MLIFHQFIQHQQNTSADDANYKDSIKKYRLFIWTTVIFWLEKLVPKINIQKKELCIFVIFKCSRFPSMLKMFSNWKYFIFLYFVWSRCLRAKLLIQSFCIFFLFFFLSRLLFMVELKKLIQDAYNMKQDDQVFFSLEKSRFSYFILVLVFNRISFKI